MIKYSRTKDAVLIEMPIETLVFAAENDSKFPVKVGDVEKFAEAVKTKLENGINPGEGETEFQILLQDCFNNIYTDAKDYVTEMKY